MKIKLKCYVESGERKCKPMNMKLLELAYFLEDVNSVDIASYVKKTLDSTPSSTCSFNSSALAWRKDRVACISIYGERDSVELKKDILFFILDRWCVFLEKRSKHRDRMMSITCDDPSGKFWPHIPDSQIDPKKELWWRPKSESKN